MIYFPEQASRYQTDVYTAEEDKEELVTFQGFRLGENTSVPAFQLKLEELAECVDLKFNPGGQLETRAPVIAYTTTEIGAIQDIKSCSLNGTQYELCTDATKLYYLLTSGANVTPTEIATLGTTANITPYNDVALLCDGSYLKYAESITSVKIAYDAGTGGTFFDNYTGVDNGVVSVSAAGVGCRFTTPAWDAGYTIPPTKVWFKVVSTTAVLTASIVRVSDSVVMATETYLADDISTSSAGFYALTFNTVTHELAPSTAYYCLLKGSGVDLSYTTNTASTGTMITAGVTLDTAKDPIMRVHPGLPPKADWAVVSGTRVWVHNPDEPGSLYFGNHTHLDFSTADGGGWVGVIDEDRNSFKIGAAADLYGELYVYGTEEQPYLCKLKGSTPSAFSLPLLFQRAWSTSSTLINTNNDLWSGSREGVDPLTGVEMYGDLRTYSASDAIKDRFENWVSDTAFSGYNAKDGQYWLYMPEYDYVSICHTKQSVTDENNQIRYPWTRYKLPITPSCFKQVGNQFLIGSTNGYIYVLDSSKYKDLDTTQIAPYFKTAYVELPFKSVDLIDTQILISCKTGSIFTVSYYKNNLRGTTTLDKDIVLSMSDTLMLADVEDMILEDMEDITLIPGTAPLYYEININCYSFQLKMSDMRIANKAVFINGFILKYRKLEA